MILFFTPPIGWCVYTYIFTYKYSLIGLFYKEHIQCRAEGQECCSLFDRITTILKGHSVMLYQKKKKKKGSFHSK